MRQNPDIRFKCRCVTYIMLRFRGTQSEPENIMNINKDISHCLVRSVRGRVLSMGIVQ